MIHCPLVVDVVKRDDNLLPFEILEVQHIDDYGFDQHYTTGNITENPILPLISTSNAIRWKVYMHIDLEDDDDDVVVSDDDEVIPKCGLRNSQSQNGGCPVVVHLDRPNRAPYRPVRKYVPFPTTIHSSASRTLAKESGPIRQNLSPFIPVRASEKKFQRRIKRIFSPTLDDNQDTVGELGHIVIRSVDQGKKHSKESSAAGAESLGETEPIRENTLFDWLVQSGSGWREVYQNAAPSEEHDSNPPRGKKSDRQIARTNIKFQLKLDMKSMQDQIRAGVIPYKT
ncbi:hypothetical protein Tco_0318196 [Tanacetum coccineum]